ncbi:MAG: ribosomal protein S18-alanine N-acetyltransferase [bacterium]|nr:ribosomal protein S18-alanine N-acetyltransferase [bacterium]
MPGFDRWRLFPMRMGDLDQVMEIENYSFPTPWRRHMYESDLKTNRGSRFYVLRDPMTNEIGSYCGTWFIYDEAHVGTIATRRENRGDRLAEQLLAYTAMQAENEGLRYMILEVRITNAAAIQLYERLGFLRVGIRRGYYTDTGEDAILMTCDNLHALAEKLQVEEG